MNDMKEWIQAIDGYNNDVMLNMNLVVHVSKVEYSTHYDCVARAINGENYTLKEDLFKGSIVVGDTIEDTWGSTKPMRIEYKKQNWTSVKDNLPPEGKIVNVCTKDGSIFVSQNICGKMLPSVTHWTPLPELPEKK